ncbi:TonB-dependent receptor domain-containing protein [Lacihabitans lacunae]|uniref:TonB-dependent receptor domain-containing protein n=1 Tax=Lacihabitans lacunae TaxID=1028214 RepID=A0ABV7YSC4_9BACT
MKNTIPLLVYFLLTLTFSALGQGTIKGKVSETNTEKSVPFATVTLHISADSSLYKAALSDSVGLFEIKGVEAGTYFLKITSLGYQNLQKNEINFENADLNLGKFFLNNDEKQLGEVVVKADKQVFEQKLGMTIVNVDSKMFKTSQHALDVLKRSPGLLVDNAGNIKFRGTSPKILIDGKDLQMSEMQQKNYLKTLSPEMIETIELISNPSVKYESAFNTVINIKLKRDKTLGLKGSAFVYYENNGFLNQNVGGNLSFKTKKFGFTTQVSEYDNFWYQYLFQDRTINNGDTKDAYKLNSFLNSPQKGVSYNFGVEYLISKKQTIDLRLSGDQSVSDGVQTSDVEFSLAGKPQPFSFSNTTTYEKSNVNTVVMGYKYKTDVSELVVEMGLSKKTKPGIVHLLTEYKNEENLLPYVSAQKNDNYSGSNFKTVNLLWSTTKIEHWKIEAGGKINLITNSAKISYDTLIAKMTKAESMVSENYKKDYERSNDFAFDENIRMGFVQASRSFEKLSFEAGLRIENTQTVGKSLQSDSAVNRNYYNWLPSINFSYPINEKNSLSFGISRKLGRPTVWELNPFPYVIDPYTYAIGNPFLYPRIRNKAELNYSYKNKFQIAFTSAYIQNMTSQITIYNPVYKSVGWVQVNLNGTNTGLDISYTDKVTKWWNYLANLNLNVGSETYSNNGKPIKQSGRDGYVYGQNTFSLPKGLILELTGFYSFGSNSGLFVSKPTKSLNANAQKSFLDGKWNIVLNMNDIFFTNISQFNLKINETNMKVINKQGSRAFSTRITYNFGKSTYKGQNRKSSVTEDSKRL